MAETSSVRQGGSRLIYMYEEKKRRKGDAEVGDQGRIPLDQDVMVEEATDILLPLDRSWRIMRFPPALVYRYIQTYEHAYIYAYIHMHTNVNTYIHMIYFFFFFLIYS